MLLDSDLGNMVDLVVGLITDLDSLDSSNSWSSNCVVSNGGSDRDDWSSVGDRVNKAILVDIFRESL